MNAAERKLHADAQSRAEGSLACVIATIMNEWDGRLREDSVLPHEYIVETPLGPWYVHPTLVKDGTECWIFTSFSDVERALKVIGDHQAGANPLGMNPFSGKWNFTSHMLFHACAQRMVFRSRGSRLADAIAAAWFDHIRITFGLVIEMAACREAANNAVIDDDKNIAKHARAAIRMRSRAGKFPVLTPRQIDRLGKLAAEIARTTE